MGTAFTMFNAVWLVDVWWPDGTTIKEQAAYCKCFASAEAAFEAAKSAYPYDLITFRHGMRVIREYRGSFSEHLAAVAGKELGG